MRTSAEKLAQLRETADDSSSKEEAPRDSCTIYCTKAFLASTNATPDLKETFSFPHGAVYCFFHNIQVCKSSQEQASKLFTSQQALEPTERQKHESRKC